MFLYIRTKSPVPGNWLLLLWDKLIVNSSCWAIFVENERKPSIFIYSLSHRTRDTHTHTPKAPIASNPLLGSHAAERTPRASPRAHLLCPRQSADAARSIEP